jgi:hypothetical protein
MVMLLNAILITFSIGLLVAVLSFAVGVNLFDRNAGWMAYPATRPNRGAHAPDGAGPAR